MDCIWVNLKNVGPPFFKLISVCIKTSFTQLENHSCFANLTFRAHGSQNLTKLPKNRWNFQSRTSWNGCNSAIFQTKKHQFKALILVGLFVSFSPLHHLYFRRTGAWAPPRSVTTPAVYFTPLNTTIALTLRGSQRCPSSYNCERWLRSFKSKGTWRGPQHAKTSKL